MFIVSLFLAVIFIISYSSILGYSVAQTTSVATTSVGPTAFATATANGVVTGFAPYLNVSVKCSNSIETNNVFTQIYNNSAVLGANNSVSAILPSRHNLSIDTNTANALQVYNYLYSKLNTSAELCATFYTGETVRLPKDIIFNAGGQKVPVILPNNTRNYTLFSTLSQNMSLIIPLRISALLTQSGAIYKNLSVSRAQV